jgi:uncharacterized membrane protein YeiB
MSQDLLRFKFESAMYDVWFVLLLFKLAMFIDAAFRKDDAFRAAERQKKSLWLILLGIGVAADFFLSNGDLIGIFSIASVIVALIYVLDVRPAVKAVTKNRGGPHNR